MKKVILLFLCIVMTMGLSAQMVNKKFVLMKDIDMFYNGSVILENDAEQFSAYLYPRVEKKSMFHKKMLEHQIAVFNKKKRAFTYHQVRFSTPHFLQTAFDTGDDIFATYTYYKKKNTIYCTGHLSKDGTPNAQTKIRLTIPSQIDWSKQVVSPDGKLHAVIILAAFKKNRPKAYVFVYDSTGEEVNSYEFSPSTASPYFAFSNAVLSNNGDLTMLFIPYERQGKQGYNGFSMPLSNALTSKFSDPKSTSLHVVQLVDGDVIEYPISHFDFGEIHSAGILQLDNGTFFLGGYYGGKTATPSVGYFSCIFDPNSENNVETHNYMLPPEQQAQDKHMVMFHLKYRIYVQDIVRLENGKIVMLGEHRAYDVQSTRMGNTITTYHSNWASDIVYQTFDTNGECERNDMVRKLQSYNTGPYTPPETFSKICFSFPDYMISYYHFVIGNDIYLVYNNCLEHEQFCNPVPMNYGKSCMRLTKLSADGKVDYKTILKCSVRKSYIQSLMLVDDNKTVYICTNGKQGFGIESFEIKE